MSWEHRAQRRVLTVVPVLIFGELTHGKGHTVNLSKDGCVIAAAYDPEKGEHLQLLVQAPERETSINIQLAIVRWSALGLFGVEFVSDNMPHRQGLQHYSYTIDLHPSLDTRVHQEGSTEETQPQRAVAYPKERSLLRGYARGAF